MLDALLPLLKAVVVVPLTLLPIINPPSVAPVFVATVGSDATVVARLARQVAINAFFVVAGSLLIGTYVLEFFGISLPIVRIGGGLLVASAGWRMLHSRDDDDEVRSAAVQQTTALSYEALQRKSFYPLTFPLMTGPGTIAASIALGAQIPDSPILYLAHATTAVVGAALTAAVIYLSNRHAGGMLGRLGPLGTLVMMRLAAFILLCMGLDILWTGWVELNAMPRTL
jgi:multiple antibiotic resistance protein